MIVDTHHISDIEYRWSVILACSMSKYGTYKHYMGPSLGSRVQTLPPDFYFGSPDFHIGS